MVRCLGTTSEYATATCLSQVDGKTNNAQARTMNNCLLSQDDEQLTNFIAGQEDGSIVGDKVKNMELRKTKQVFPKHIEA